MDRRALVHHSSNVACELTDSVGRAQRHSATQGALPPFWVYSPLMILSDWHVNPGDFEARTGWTIKAEGACKADVCVPLAIDPRTPEGRLDLRVVAECLGMPLVLDEANGMWALGPETAVTGRALSSAVSPELTLPDVGGRPFALSSLRGQKILLLAWASW